MPEPRLSPIPPERSTDLDLVKGISAELTSSGLPSPSSETNRDGGVGSVIKDLIEVIRAIGTYGLPTAIFALPLVVACFGLYFLYVGVNAPAVNMAKVGVGGGTLLFGSGYLTGLLHYFNKYQLWEKMKSWQQRREQKAREA